MYQQQSYARTNSWRTRTFFGDKERDVLTEWTVDRGGWWSGGWTTPRDKSEPAQSLFGGRPLPTHRLLSKWPADRRPPGVPMLVGSGDGEDVSVYGESLGAQALVGESGVAERLRRAAADLKLREGSGVRSLTLFSCGLSSLHGLPVELGSTIMSLNLSSNEIGPSLVLLPELGFLTRLVRLDLSSNRVERLTPPAQPASKTATGDGLLPALRQLCVAHNRIASLEVRSNHTSRHHPPRVQTLSQRWKLPAAANCLGRSVMRALCSQQTHTFQSERIVVRVSIISLISLSPSLSLSWRHARLCSVLRALCSVLRAPCSVLCALCSVLRAPGSVLRAVCSVLGALCSVLRAPCSVLRAP